MSEVSKLYFTYLYKFNLFPPTILSSFSKRYNLKRYIATMGRRGVSTILPDDFAPAQYTVLCGRGKEYTSSTGNLHLKSLVLKYLSGYSEAKSKVAKSAIVSEILSEIKGLCPNAAFVKMEDEAWREVDDAFAREKIGMSFSTSAFSTHPCPRN